MSETEMNEKKLIGLKKEDAVALIKSAGFKVRIRSEDGKAFMGTCDYRLDRYNLTIVDGLVTTVSKG